MDQTNGSSIQEDISRPKVYLPGDEKFSSYKNSLQEYCQKKRMDIPQYKTTKVSGGVTATLTFSTHHFSSPFVAGNVKDAESRIAFEALQRIGYLQAEKYVGVDTQLKRKVLSGNAVSLEKKVKSESVANHKSTLHEYAQKHKKELPTYNTVASGGGFISTLKFDGQEYRGDVPGSKIKDAEQIAAKVALAAVTGQSVPQQKVAATTKPSDELDINQMISEQRNTTASIQPSSLKNRLQEYCQRLGKSLPTYTTVYLEADRFYQSVVQVEAVEYSGLPKSGKKNAEFAAAEVALRDLDLMS